MWFSIVASIIITFSSFVSAIPASNHIPTAITQAAGGNSNGTDLASNPSNPVPDVFDQRFPVPGTDTVLRIAKGSKANPYSLEILLTGALFDLDSLIRKHGPQAVPGNPDIPIYSFLTTTPGGEEGYFFVRALSTAGLTYQLVNETLAGLRIFLLNQGRNEQPVFRVEDLDHTEAFGGVSVGPSAETLKALSNDTSLASDPTTLAVLSNIDVRLRCHFAKPLSPAAILQLLSIVRNKAKEMIQQEGPDGYLPGQTGQYTADGHLGAEFDIRGITPHRLTWQIMAGAVEGLKNILLEHHVAREAQCSVAVGDNIVGIVQVSASPIGVRES
ncbi:MAG: hypothetical protein Q9225_003655 [Loekoesia sp. 1 TL-2023]